MTSIVPATTTIEGCNWKNFPVNVEQNSVVYQNQSAIISIIDATMQNTIHQAELNVANLAPIAAFIQTEHLQAMQNYHDSLKNAIHKDKGRKRYVNEIRTLSICSNYDTLAANFKASKKRAPNFFEKIWLRLKSVFVAHTYNEMVLRDFPEEYNDYHRREWMVAVVTSEKTRIDKAIKLITNGAIRYATNIRNAREESKPVHENDLIYLNQMIKLYNVLKPNEAFELPNLGSAKKYLTE